MNKIAIHSVPRSGSTWLGKIFDSNPEVSYKYQPLFSYALKGHLSENSTRKEINSFFFDLVNTKEDFIDQKKEKGKGIIPEFKKKDIHTIVYKEVRYHHILPNLLKKDETIKVIGLVRNPLSVISSWLKAPKEFRVDMGWNVEEEWRFAPKKNLEKPEEFNGYEKWKEIAFSFLSLKKEYPERFYLLDYKDLIKEPQKEVIKLFSFCGFEVGQQTFKFIEESTQKNDENAYSVYKNKKDDNQWKEELPEFIIKKIKSDPEFIELNQIFKWI